MLQSLDRKQRMVHHSLSVYTTSISTSSFQPKKGEDQGYNPSEDQLKNLFSQSFCTISQATAFQEWINIQSTRTISLSDQVVPQLLRVRSWRHPRDGIVHSLTLKNKYIVQKIAQKWKWMCDGQIRNNEITLKFGRWSS